MCKKMLKIAAYCVNKLGKGIYVCDATCKSFCDLCAVFNCASFNQVQDLNAIISLLLCF